MWVGLMRNFALHMRDPPQTFRVQWLDSKQVICDTFQVQFWSDDDTVTRSIDFQNDLNKLVSAKSASEIRAFVGFDQELELTLRPRHLNNYFKSFWKQTPYCDARLEVAWSKLRESKAVPIVVTRYDPVECAIGYIQSRYSLPNWQFSHNSIDHLFCNLPAELRINDRLLGAYIQAGLHTKSVPVDAWAKPNVHLWFAKHHGQSTWEFAPHALQQNKTFALQLTKQLWRGKKRNRLQCHALPPHVDDVYSDCLHDRLYRTDYTREDVLSRVALCGDALKLHQAWFADCEVVLAACKSARSYTIEHTRLSSMWSDKQFVLQAVTLCGNAVSQACTWLKNDYEIGLAAVSQSYLAYASLSERLRSMPDIALRAASHHGLLERVPLAIQTNKALVLKLVALNNQVFDGFDGFDVVPTNSQQTVYNSTAFMTDQHFMLDCVEANWRMAFYLPVEQRQSSYGFAVRAAACKHFRNARCACHQLFLEPFAEHAVRYVCRNLVEQPNQPDVQPDVQPTVQPDVQPDVQPTVQPAVQPDVQPTVQPDVQPAVQPSVQTDVQPTVQPTVQPASPTADSAEILKCAQLMDHHLVEERLVWHLIAAAAEAASQPGKPTTPPAAAPRIEHNAPDTMTEIAELAESDELAELLSCAAYPQDDPDIESGNDIGCMPMETSTAVPILPAVQEGVKFRPDRTNHRRHRYHRYDRGRLLHHHRGYRHQPRGHQPRGLNNVLQAGANFFFKVTKSRLFVRDASPGEAVLLIRRMQRGQDTRQVELIDCTQQPRLLCQVEQNVLTIECVKRVEHNQHEVFHVCQLLVSSDAAQRLLLYILCAVG